MKKILLNLKSIFLGYTNCLIHSLYWFIVYLVLFFLCIIGSLAIGMYEGYFLLKFNIILFLSVSVIWFILHTVYDYKETLKKLTGEKLTTKTEIIRIAPGITDKEEKEVLYDKKEILTQLCIKYGVLFGGDLFSKCENTVNDIDVEKAMKRIKD